MSEDRFFDQVRETLHDYAPNVPQGVYGAMRKKLWWGNFTKLSATRFNMWYALLIIGVGSIWIVGKIGSGSITDAQPALSEQNAIPTFKSFDTICTQKANMDAVTTAYGNVNCSSSEVNSPNQNSDGPVRSHGVGAIESPSTAPSIGSVLPAYSSDAATPKEIVVIEAKEISEQITPIDEINTVGTGRKGTPFTVTILRDDSLKSDVIKKSKKKN